MDKHVCLRLSILELSKILMYEFWYDYVKAKYGERVKLCYMDTDSFIVYIKADDIYKDIVKDVESRFNTPNYESDSNWISKKSNWINERRIRQKNNDKICWIKSKNL